MSEKRLNNTILLMYAVSCAYCAAHGIANERFLELDAKYGILHLVEECPDIFDPMTEEEMVKEVDDYVGRFQ